MEKSALLKTAERRGEVLETRKRGIKKPIRRAVAIFKKYNVIIRGIPPASQETDSQV